MKYSLAGKRIWVTGHRGLVGSSIVRNLHSRNLNVLTSTREELDLTNQAMVSEWVSHHKPEVIIHCAAKVGGINVNAKYPVDFLAQNLQIGLNVITAAAQVNVERLVNLASACIYPRDCESPLNEKQLFTSALEPTNEAYALAKISILKLVEYYNTQLGKSYITVIPTNSFGPNDNYDLNSAHVPAALIRKMYHAVETNADTVEVWGTGTPIRDFIYSDDLASAVIHCTENYFSHTPINISTGVGCSISELAHLIKKVANFTGRLTFNTAMPDGMPIKVLDNDKLVSLGWNAKHSLTDGLENTWMSVINDIANNDLSFIE